jgi:hypothetical protein
LPRLLPNGESGLTVSVRSSLYVDDLIGERGGNRTHDPLIKSHHAGSQDAWPSGPHLPA